MRSVNKVILLGHLGKDAEVKFTPSGVQRAQFSIATSRRWKDKQSGDWKEETDWHNCILWRCENVVTYLTRGQPVYIEGRLQTRSYDKDGQKHWVTEVIVDDLNLLNRKEGGTGSGMVSQPRGASTPQVGATDPLGITDDDVPF